MDHPKPGQNIRTHDGEHRIKYNPSWVAYKPYKLYTRGTARNTYRTLKDAQRAAGYMQPSSWGQWC